MPRVTVNKRTKIRSVVGKIHDLLTPPAVFTRVARANYCPGTSHLEFAFIASENSRLKARDDDSKAVTFTKMVLGAS